MRPRDDIKLIILETIFERFEHWSKPFGFACHRGCSSCCTQNVTVTALEAKLVLDSVVAAKRHEWLGTKLAADLPARGPALTTNQFAQMCLTGEDPPDVDSNFDTVCPFLENGLCTIYPVRPFSCRGFASTEVCRRGSSAVLPPVYLSAATVVSQLIEHLDQSSPWGNFLHVLFVLGCTTGIIDESGSADKLTTARSHCTTSRPLPGFLLDETEAEQITPLLESIFSSTVDGRSIEDILNNR